MTRAEFENVAIAVADGRMTVLEAPDVLDIAEANEQRPIPVAAYRTGAYCVVLLITKQSDRSWRTDIVPVKDADVESSGGGCGGLLRRSQVMTGSPAIDGEALLPVDENQVLLQIDGVSADNRVRLKHAGTVVGEADVAAHGYFVIAALLPAEVDIKEVSIDPA